MCPLPVIWNKSYLYDRIIIGSYHLPSLENLRDLQIYYKIQQKRTPEYPSGTIKHSYSPLVPIILSVSCFVQHPSRTDLSVSYLPFQQEVKQ